MATFDDPQRIGRYEVKGRIGRGGMGTVYRAEDPHIGRIVAVKVLDATDDQSRHARFRQEVRSAGTLDHQHIVTVHDFGEDGGRPFIVMEYVDGRTLAEVLRDQGPPPLADTLRIVRQLCDALEYAHERGVIHRDIKPSNLMLDRRGALRVVDFGIARTNDGDLTTTGEVMGTVRYTSPEQLEGKPIDRRTDVFSVGVVLYELLTGQHAFQGESSGQLIRNILTGQPRAIAQLRADIDPALDRIVSKAIQKKPLDRYDSLSSVAADLAAIDVRRVPESAALEPTRLLVRGGGELPTLSRHDSAPGSGARAGRPFLGWVTAVAVVFALMGAAAVWLADSLTSGSDSASDSAPPTERPDEPPARAAAPLPRPETRNASPVTSASVDVPSTAAPVRTEPARPIQVAAAKPPAIAKDTATKTNAEDVPRVAPPPQAPATTLYAEGQALERSGRAGDLVRGLEIYKRACGSGDGAACNRAGFLLRNNAAIRNLSEAAQMFQRACDGGHASGCTSLGLVYARGDGLPRDEGKAVSLFERACEGGDGPGCLNSGRAYRSGRGVVRNQPRARTLLQNSCDDSVPMACLDLGLMLARGEGGAVDERAAVELFRRGCNAGIPPACTNLGIAYARGTAIPKDDAQAVSLYQGACNAKDAAACSYAAGMYASGRGVAKDDSRASALFQQACDGNFAAGCRALAQRYERGLGVALDLARAAELLGRADTLTASPAPSAAVGNLAQ